MKFLRIFIVLVMQIALASPAAAAGRQSLAAYWSRADAGDAGNSNGFGAKLSFASNQNACFEIRGGVYDDFSKDIKGPGDAVLKNFQMTPLEAGYTLYGKARGKKTTPFAGAGAGYYLMEGDAAGSSADIDAEISWFANGGLLYELKNDAFLYGEIMYRGLDASAASRELRDLGVDAIDINLDGITFNVGLQFPF